MNGPIDAYVSELAKALPGPRHVRRDLLSELEDGLRDAADAHRACGLPAREAELRAVHDNGPLDDLVTDYRTELAARSGRHTATQLIVLLLASNLAWDLIWYVAPSGGPPLPGVSVLAGVITCSAVLCAAICGLGLALLRQSGRGPVLVPVRRINHLIVSAGAGAIALIVGSALAMNLINVEDSGRMLSDSAALGVLTAASVLAVLVLVSALWRTARTTLAVGG